MTDKRFKELLKTIQTKVGLSDDETFFNYLDTAGDDELSELTRAVGEELGENAEVFRKKLTNYLIIKAKPWASEEDISIK